MKKSSVLILMLVFFACSPSNRITITNINDLATISANTHIYSLPLSRISIAMTAVRHVTIPGPYNAYAEKYLGFTGVPSISKTDWELLDIKLSSITEPDPEYCFSVQTNQPAYVMEQLNKLSSEGLVIATYDYFSFSQFYTFLGDKPEPFHFPDLSVKPTIESDIRKTVQKGNQSNTENVTHPVKHEEELKSLEEKAEEAANFIIKLRKRRFKLLVGQDQSVHDSAALETSVRELHKLEKEYLALFIGKTYSDTLKKNFFYTPVVSQDIERNVICRFSDETGFQDESGNSGMPLVLELKNMKVTEALRNLQLGVSGPTFSNILLYRIPEKASAHIFYGGSIILEAEINVFQYGALVPLKIGD